MQIGVLALQGDFAEHIEMLSQLNISAKEIRTLADLESLTHLILPGGESTVMSQFLQKEGLMEKIRERALDGSLSIFGTCAGAILLAKEVTGKNPPETLKLLDITVDRNAYGTQVDSFMSEIDIEGIGKKMVSFIRAPIITKVSSFAKAMEDKGTGVKVLATYKNQPVLVQQNNLLAAAFHTEVGGDNWLHKLFIGD